MARPIKQGLDYFPLDVGFLQDVKVRRIMRACGTQSIPVLISLLANIYRNEGYFLRWDNDMPFLIADEIGVSEGAVTATVDKAVQVDFFNANMLEQYGVLTSSGIQTRFFEAVRRRSIARYDARFLLINVSVYKNAVSVDRNQVNVADNTQSKVKEKKVNESRVKGKNTDRSNPDVLPYKAFQIYSNNIRPISSDIGKDRLLDLIEHYGDEWVCRAIERAVMRGNKNLRYISAILRNWEEYGYDDDSANVSRKEQPRQRKNGKQQAISDVMDLLAEYEQEAMNNGNDGNS